MSQIANRLIPLGELHCAIIDDDDYVLLSFFKWYAARSQRCWYAKTTFPGPRGNKTVSMHRLINKTPTRMVCHHRNHNTLDNRKQNLVNMPPKEHQKLHQNDTLLIQFENSTAYPHEWRSL